MFTRGPVAQRIRHLTTNQGIPGSNPGGVVCLFYVLISLSQNSVANSVFELEEKNKVNEKYLQMVLSVKCLFQ